MVILLVVNIGVGVGVCARCLWLNLLQKMVFEAVVGELIVCNIVFYESREICCSLRLRCR